MTNENEQVKQLIAVCEQQGITGKLNEAGQFVAVVNGNEVTTDIRIIEDIQGELTCRVIKDKKGNVSVVICNLPTVEELVKLDNEVISAFINKYFASAFTRKLISLPNITKVVDLLTPQSGAGFIANPLTAPYNAVIKLLTNALKAKVPAKARLLSEKAVKTYLADVGMMNLAIGSVQVKNKTVNAYDYAIAVMKQKLADPEINGGLEIDFDEFLQFIKEQAAKATSKVVETTIDEDDLDI